MDKKICEEKRCASFIPLRGYCLTHSEFIEKLKTCREEISDKNKEIINKQNNEIDQSKLKPITKEIVRNYSKKIFNNLGYITTLDVKNELRKHNYWAVQSSVSKFIDEIFEEDNWDWNVEYNYKIYYLKTPSFFKKIEIKRNEIKNWISENCKNKFFSISIIKKDNIEKKIVCKLGDKKNNIKQTNNILKVFDINIINNKDKNIRGDYRNINIETINEIRFKNTIIEIID